MARHNGEEFLDCHGTAASRDPSGKSRTNGETPRLTTLTANDSNGRGSGTVKVTTECNMDFERSSTPTSTAPFTESPTSSLCDSRIPRPSPTGLRRSLSMRMHGERGPPHPSPSSTTATIAATGTTVLNRQSHFPRYNTLRHQHHHQHPDYSTFPVITEYGTDSPRQRSFSLSLTTARPRSGLAASRASSAGVADDSDAESIKSFGSACSTASACDHATFALNGTTWSARSQKYVVHCSNQNADNEQYLTPTQRAARQVRKFQALLKEARKEIEEKDREIFRLTKEVVELRLYKASLNSPDERTDSSDAITVRENNPLSPDTPSNDVHDDENLQKVVTPSTPEKRVQSDIPSSLADSGHFEDGSIHSKDSVYLPETQAEVAKTTSAANQATSDLQISANTISRTTNGATEREEERRRLVDHYEARIEEMHRRHIDEIQELKQKHNDKVESLLNQLTEVNTRYYKVRPSMDAAEARVKELESELETVKAEVAEKRALLDEQEERNKQIYLKMYTRGQEAARLEQADMILSQTQQTPSKVTVAELLQQLTVTQAELENLKAMYRRIVEAKSRQGALDPEITLQFLKSAVYYFLTDKENHQGHLNAIESILGFTEAEKHSIDKIYRSARK